MPETYLEPYQTSKKRFAKRYVLDIWQCSEYVSVCVFSFYFILIFLNLKNKS